MIDNTGCKNTNYLRKQSPFKDFFVTLAPNMEAVTKIPQEWNKFYLKDVSFVNLMTRRIFNVLIVANPYDAFMLEDDGRVDEKIFDEYMELGMRYPPTFTQVSTMPMIMLTTASISILMLPQVPQH